MTHRHSHSAAGEISILFHPSVVPVIDVFRSLHRLDDQYDLTLLDEPEQALRRHARPEIAKALVSDALLLAFAMTRQRGRPLSHQPLKSRHGSFDEYCLMTLIAALRAPSSELAVEAAGFLGIVSLDFMTSLAEEMGRQMDQDLLVFKLPGLGEFRALMGGRNIPIIPGEPEWEPGFTFRV